MELSDLVYDPAPGSTADISWSSSRSSTPSGCRRCWGGHSNAGAAIPCGLCIASQTNCECVAGAGQIRRVLTRRATFWLGTDWTTGRTTAIRRILVRSERSSLSWACGRRGQALRSMTLQGVDC